MCGLILPPGADSYRNRTGGGQGVGCFTSLCAQTALSTKTFETEWYKGAHGGRMGRYGGTGGGSMGPVIGHYGHWVGIVRSYGGAPS